MKDNVFNINIYETVANSSEYIPIIIGGLFGLTTLMLAVFSLISNDVTKKTSGFSLINLKRYKRWLLLLPIYLVFITTFLMMFFESLNNETFLFISTVVIILVVSLQTNFILQPLYNQNKCKQAIIKNRVNSFKKKIKKSKTNNKIEEILENEKVELFDLIAFDNEENKYVLLNDKKIIYTSYIEVLREKKESMNESLNISLIEIGINIFGDDFVDISSDFEFPEIILLDVFLNRNKTKFSISLHQRNLELIHTLFESHRNGAPIETIYNDEQIILFLTQTVMNPEAMIFILNYIFDTANWSYSDSSFIKFLLSVFSNSFHIFSKMYETYLNEETYKRFEDIMINFKNKKELKKENDEFDIRFNLIIKTLSEV